VTVGIYTFGDSISHTFSIDCNLQTALPIVIYNHILISRTYRNIL
jgi:hypothetical protein